MLYSVSYDLQNATSEYQELYNGIKDFGTWWHQTESVWMIKTEKSAKEIRDYLTQFIKDGDKLFVIEVKKHWAGIGFSGNEYDWLKKNLE